ncbi:MAG: 6-carboxytetrahydropterin synthase [Helicobacteraceae bacterium]|jgi:6-pyruvoyltetrahydropterin/6-carboxytetrahydropterin synthase|nr:6-carboxytetrahydropterin synthase [Helicobacteraceae bacterium]
MIIRKLFRFESAHILRGAEDARCRESIHGHSYKAELLLESNRFREGQLVLDFTRVKEIINFFIDIFDHSIIIWKDDSAEFIEVMKKFSSRWVILGVNPSAEQFARVIFWFARRALAKEWNVSVYSVIVHETESGYAQAFLEDVNNESMGVILAEDFAFSKTILEDNDSRKRFTEILGAV